MGIVVGDHHHDIKFVMNKKHIINAVEKGP